MIHDLFSHISLLRPHLHISVQGRLCDERLHGGEHLLYEQEHLTNLKSESVATVFRKE